MLRALRLIFTISVCLLQAPLVRADFDLKPCNLLLQKGTLCTIRFGDICPTQFRRGPRAVQEKTDKYLKLMKQGKYEKYWLEHPVPIVIGKNRYFITDKHHNALGDYRAHNYDKDSRVVGLIRENWQNNPNFIADMTHHKPEPYSYLYDQNGNLRTFEELMRERPDLLSMTDDPFRDLGAEVRDEGGFNPFDQNGKKLYFIEFIWGDFFKAYFAPEDLEKHWKSTIKKAVEIAHSPAAAHLPGYSPKKVKQPDR
jgi:hypothetical protein